MFGDFLKAVWVDWVARVSGIGSVLLTIAGGLAPKFGWPQPRFWAMAGLALIFTSYRVWANQRSLRRTEEEQAMERGPRIVLEYRHHNSGRTPPEACEKVTMGHFELQNEGPTAFEVAIHPIRNGEYTATFVTVPKLLLSEKRCILPRMEKEGGIGPLLREQFRLLLADNWKDLNEHVLTLPVTVTYKDIDNREYETKWRLEYNRLEELTYTRYEGRSPKGKASVSIDCAPRRSSPPAGS